MSSSGAARRVYLMTDHGSTSLWTDDPHHGVDPAALGLSPDTGEALRRWSEMEEANFDAWMDGQETPYPTEVYWAEGMRLWHVVREELGNDYEVGFAFADPDPWDEYSSIKRIVWDPAEAPSVDEVLAADEQRTPLSDAEYSETWRTVIADAASFCRQQAGERDRRTDPVAGAYLQLAESLRDDLLVNRSQLALLTAAAVRWAVDQPGYTTWRERQQATPDALLNRQETIAGELPQIVKSILEDLERSSDRTLVLDSLRDALADAGPEARERWSVFLDTWDVEPPSS